VRDPSPPRSARRGRDPGPGSARAGRTLQLVLHPPRGPARRGPARLARTDRSRPLLAAPLDALQRVGWGSPALDAIVAAFRARGATTLEKRSRGTSSRRVRCLRSAPRTRPSRLRQVHHPLTGGRGDAHPQRQRPPHHEGQAAGARTRAPSSPRSRSQPAPRQRRRGLLRRCHPLGEAGGVRRRAPHQGPAVAFAGRLEPRPWKGREGEQRVALEVHGVELEYVARPRGDAGAERSDDIPS
jgi:hypothetical protein